MKDLQLNVLMGLDQLQRLLRDLVAACVYMYVIQLLVGASSKW